MSNQIVISSGAKVRNLDGVLTGTSGIVNSVPLGAANGVATLDSGGKVPVSQLPSSVVTYLGTWNAATNTPTLVNGTGDAGDMYICNVAGTVNFGAGPVTFAVGDWVLYGSGTWQKSNGQNGTVTSVAVTESGDALTITGSPITTAGTINIGFAGTSGQYVNGAGGLTTFPSLAGYVTSVTATAPLLSSGGTTPDLSIPAASSTVDGYLDNADWTTFNNKQNAITLTTTGTSGVSTLIGSTLNIPNYSTDLSGYVPYTGATANVNLGTFDLTADVITGATGSFASNGGSNTFAINHSSGSGIALNITKGGNGEGLYINKTSGSGNAATIIGTLNATTLVKSGGTSSQFLKADGSVDASAYITLTSLSAGTGISYNNTTGVITNSAPDQTVSLTAGAGISISGTYPSFTIASTITQYTDALARAALSFTAGSGAYNSTTGVITIPTNNNQITNGSNFITLTSLSAGAGISYNNTTGAISSTITQYTDALARAAISLTTTGTSGAATYNNTTGVLNIPNYAPDLSGYVTLSTAQTISGVKTFSSVIGATASAVFNATGRGTDYQYADMTNTNGRMIIGVDSSVGGSIIPSNSQPYSVSFGTDKNRFLHLFTNDLPRLNITGGGNVLIGTLTDGGYKLDVSAKGRFLSSVGAEVLRVEGPSTTDNFISVYSGTIHMFIDADNSNSAGIIGTQSTHPLIFRTNGVNKARITTDGNLLINTTTNSGFKLDVNGTGRFTGLQQDAIQTIFTLYGYNAANQDKALYFRLTGSTPVWTLTTGAVGTDAGINIMPNGSAGLSLTYAGAATFSSSVTATSAFFNASNGFGLAARNAANTQYRNLIILNSGNQIEIGRDSDISQIRLGTASANDALTITSGGLIYVNTTTGVSGGGALQVNGNVNINGVFQINGTTIGGGGGSGITGSGTSGYHSKWTGASTLGNGILYDDGTRIGLNTTSIEANTRFQINYSGGSSYGLFINKTTSDEATIRFKSTHDANSDFKIGASILIGSAFEIYSVNAAATRFAVASNGNVLINRTTDAGYKFDVNGTGRFTGQLTGTDALFAGSVTASSGFFDTSDSRLKILVKDYEQPKGIENVAARMYIKNSKKELGYYAQDLQEILPSAVNEGTDGFLTLSYSQVHTAKIAYLEKEVAELKELIKSLIK